MSKTKAKKPQPKRKLKIGRDAETGRFMKLSQARRRKSTSIEETIKYY
ncbi:hypothetical protein [Vibrio coralliilyticus]|nr:hypothetical protein [Vibrio coralliilyticus]NUW69802.1 hypothetical protein [Vibrio coralliilyticus]